MNAALCWTVGKPFLHDDIRGAEHWEQWAYDARETPQVRKRSREWTAVGKNELECVPRDGALPAGDQRRTGAAVIH